MEPEEGELSSSSDEVYTPLQRPETAASIASVVQPEQTINEILDDVDSLTSSEDDSSDNCLKNDEDKSKRKKCTKRTVMLRVKAAAEEDAIKRARFKKYNIWTATAEEEALTENMRGCDVTRKKIADRSVETYDFDLVNGRKRRRDGDLDDEMYPVTKRGRDSSQEGNSGQRESVKSRLGHRLILDLDDVTSNRDPIDVGREMANKLYEEKDDLLVRIVQVLGIELATEIYNETKKIEADGGLLINNGARRRTPGGVFLYLLKNHDHITYEDRKLIFDDDRKNDKKSKKEIETALRDRKVQELKQRLSKHDNLPTLSTRKELLAESQGGNLSNPPPSPVVGQENSPEYKNPAIINHVVPDACPSTSSSNAFKDIAAPNDDLDFLDLNYADMDFF